MAVSPDDLNDLKKKKNKENEIESPPKVLALISASALINSFTIRRLSARIFSFHNTDQKRFIVKLRSRSDPRLGPKGPRTKDQGPKTWTWANIKFSLSPFKPLRYDF